LGGLTAWKFGAPSRIQTLVGLETPPFTVHAGEVFYSSGTTLLALPVAGGTPRAAAEGIPHYLTYFPVPELGLAFRERPESPGKSPTGNEETIHFLPWSTLHHFRVRIRGGRNTPVITGSDCYWVQDDTHRLLCQPLNGSAPHVVAAGLKTGAAVATDRGNVFWTGEPPAQSGRVDLHYRLSDGNAGTISDAIGSENWTAPVAVGERLFWLRESSDTRPSPTAPDIPVITPIRTDLLSVQKNGQSPKTWVHLEESASGRQRLWVLGSIGDTLYVERETVHTGSIFSTPVAYDLCRFRPNKDESLERVTTLPSAPLGWLDGRSMYFVTADIREPLWTRAGQPERVLRYVVRRVAL
jgi:hypothetical protein